MIALSCPVMKMLASNLLMNQTLISILLEMKHWHEMDRIGANFFNVLEEIENSGGNVLPRFGFIVDF